jgi:hypothetical protein
MRLARSVIIILFSLVTVDTFALTSGFRSSMHSRRSSLLRPCNPARTRQKLDSHRPSPEQGNNGIKVLKEKRNEFEERSMVENVKSLLIACSMSLYLIGSPLSASAGSLLDEFGSDGSKIVETSIDYQSARKGENAIDPTLRACKCVKYHSSSSCW